MTPCMARPPTRSAPRASSQHDNPRRSAGSGLGWADELTDVVRRHHEIGDETVETGAFAPRVADLDRKPRDRQRVPGIAQRHAGQPAPDRRRAFAAFDTRDPKLFEARAIQIFIDGLMRGGPADENEVSALMLDRLGDRLTGEQVITDEDRLQAPYRWRLPRQPAFGGIAFAVLFLRPVLGHDELGRRGTTRLRPGATRLAPRNA